METKVKGMLIGVLVAVLFAGFAQNMAFGQVGTSPTISMTGTIYAPDAKDVKGGLATVKLVVDKTEWLFNITKAEDISDGDKSGEDIADSLSESLVLREDKKGVLAPLQKLDAAGKTITIQGTYYEDDELMDVTSLTMGK